MSTRQQKAISSIGIDFRHSFNKNRLPDEKAQQHLTNLNDKIMNLFERMTNLILVFLTCLAT